MLKEIKKGLNIWRKLMYVLTPEQKKYGIVVFLMSIFGALLETLGVSVIIPVVQAMISPRTLFTNSYAAFFLDLFGITTESGLVLLMCFAVVIVYVFKNAYLVFLSWVRAKYSSKIMREISVRIMHSYMKRNYSFFLKTNIGELVRGTSGDANGIYNIIYQGFRIASESLTAFFICVYIVSTDFQLAMSVVIVGFICLVLIGVVFRKLIKKFADMNWKYAALVSKYMMEAYGGIKEILVMRRQKFFVSKYENAYKEQQKAVIGNTVSAESPAYIIEAICISGIIIAVGFRVRNMADPSSFIPQLSAFAIAAFKILPSLGRISSAFNTFVYHIPFLNDAYNDFTEVNNAEKSCSQEMNDSFCEAEKIKFKKCLTINSITWKYSDAEEPVLKDLSLTVWRGESIGIIGESGAGKSTLMDVILGLYRPQKGNIAIDNTDVANIPNEWSKMIGYVPQTVYLTNDTIRNNVTFGIPEENVSDNQVWNALSEAHIADYVESLPDKLDTVVGDRGVRFSGGQRQRIAIARAIYYDPEILVFDEATSALDNETEASVMESIEMLHGKKTLIIVAHRLSTIQKCDRVFEVKDGHAVLKKIMKVQ